MACQDRLVQRGPPIRAPVQNTARVQPMLRDPQLQISWKDKGGDMFSVKTQAWAIAVTATLVNLAQADGYDSAVPGGVQQAQALADCPPGAASPAYGQYPQLSAPLYPSPVQYTPPYNGGTIITNQAFAPHEMLYPHTYHAMYPPFFYKVNGGWIWTPLGMRQHENWQVQGTEVTVKYRSHYPLFGGYHPPDSNPYTKGMQGWGWAWKH